jgi:hypothetical protein
MKNKGKFPGTKGNVYTGLCKKCGESYEAESGGDDLDGVTFRCKKFLCSGKVSLQLTEAGELEAPIPMNGFQVPTPPKKFC